MTIFKNIITALITPFKAEDAYQIDYQALEKLLAYQLNAGIEAFIINGTTGEAATQTSDELLAVIKFAKKYVGDKASIIAGTGSNNTQTTIKHSMDALKHGADALMIVTPYYNKPTEPGIYQHYVQICMKISAPIMLYNHPGRTGLNLSNQLIAELAKIDNIQAIKDASGDLDKAFALKKTLPQEFAILTGNDSQILPFLCLGGNGAVSVTSNVAPTELVKLQTYCNNNNYQAAKEIHHKLFDLYNNLFLEASPAATKYALEIMNIVSRNVRLPLINLSESAQQIIKQNLKELGHAS